MDTEMSIESPDGLYSDILGQIIKLQGEVQSNTDVIIKLFKEHGERIAKIESELVGFRESIEVSIKQIHSNTGVNQELIKANAHYNSICNETEIPPLPPLKVETKLKVKVEEFGDVLLLLGQTFDVKDKLKEIAAARYNSTPPEKKGWMIQIEQLQSVIKQLSDICDFDTSLISACPGSCDSVASPSFCCPPSS